MMNIAIGSDHAGLNLKQAVISYLSELGHTYEDFGTYDTNLRHCAGGVLLDINSLIWL